MSKYKPTGTCSDMLWLRSASHGRSSPRRPGCSLGISWETHVAPSRFSLTSLGLFLENDGLTKSGEPDKRVGTGEFAHGQADPHVEGQKGGQTGGSADVDATGEDSGDSGSGGGKFAGGKVDPVEAGRKGGSSS